VIADRSVDTPVVAPASAKLTDETVAVGLDDAGAKLSEKLRSVRDVPAAALKNAPPAVLRTSKLAPRPLVTCTTSVLGNVVQETITPALLKVHDEKLYVITRPSAVMEPPPVEFSGIDVCANAEDAPLVVSNATTPASKAAFNDIQTPFDDPVGFHDRNVSIALNQKLCK
jgi:hypothetical protein